MEYPITVGKIVVENKEGISSSGNNLLPNGDFSLNTSGQTEWIDEGSTYIECVNGWKFGYGNSRCSIISTGGLHFDFLDHTATNLELSDQKKNIFTHSGKYAVKIKIDDVNKFSQIFAFYVYNRQAKYITRNYTKNTIDNTVEGYFTITDEVFSEMKEATSYGFGMQFLGSATTGEIYYFKLEEGEVSTAPNGLVVNATMAEIANEVIDNSITMQKLSTEIQESIETSTSEITKIKNGTTPVGALNSIQIPSDGDLNTYIGSNYWGKTFFGTGAHNIKNSPVPATHVFTLQVLRCSENTMQIIVGGNSTNETNAPTIYTRYCTSSGAFGIWEEMTTSNGTYPDMIVGKANKLKNVLYEIGNSQLGWQEIGRYSSISDIYAYSTSVSLQLLINGIYPDETNSDNKANSGILELEFRINNGKYQRHSLFFISGNLEEDKFCASYDQDSDSLILYANYDVAYKSYNFVVLSENRYGGNSNINYFQFNFSFYGSTPPSNALYPIYKNIASDLTSELKESYATNETPVINCNFAINPKGEANYTGIEVRMGNGWVISGSAFFSPNTSIGEKSGATIEAVNGSTGYLYQFVDNVDNMWGKTITMGAMLEDGTLITGTGTFPNKAPNKGTSYFSTGFINNCQLRFYYYINSKQLAFTVDIKNGTTINLKWAKWIFGSVLPPYKEPDPIIESLRCKSQFLRIRGVSFFSGKVITALSKIYYFTIPLPVPLKRRPTITPFKASIVTNEAQEISSMEAIYTLGDTFVTITTIINSMQPGTPSVNPAFLVLDVDSYIDIDATS